MYKTVTQEDWKQVLGVGEWKDGGRDEFYYIPPDLSPLSIYTELISYKNLEEGNNAY